jgi:hypothetical protein
MAVLALPTISVKVFAAKALLTKILAVGMLVM